MRFSVIVPFKNEEKYLKACIEAVLGQQFEREEFELILIDNGSNDRSFEIASKYSDLEILKFHVPDPYLSRNIGALNARGDYLVFLDADCIPESNWLLSFEKAISKSSSGIFLGKLTLPKEPSRMLKYSEDYYHSKTQMMAETLPKECAYGHAGNMSIERKLFNSLGRFNSMPIPGDTEIIHRYLEASSALTIDYVPEAKVKHVEVKSFWESLKKQKIYGELSQIFGQTSNYRVLSFNERISVLKKCITQHQYNLWQTLLLVYSLLVGIVAFNFGRLIGWKNNSNLNQVSKKQSRLPGKFVTCNIVGGLGNQMFQIAAALAFAEKNGYKAVFPRIKRSPSSGTSRPVYWESIFHSIETRTDLSEFCFDDYSEPSFQHQEIPSFSDSIRLSGYFQSSKYFENSRQLILSTFSLPEIEQDKVNSEYLKIIEGHSSETVAIHVRRGYEADGKQLWPIEIHGLLEIEEYFKPAIDSFPSDSLFVVFSDDIDWCRTNFPANCPDREFAFSSNTDYIDLFLMAKCHHQIISNSSFGWWAAYLNQYASKKIIAPTPWFGPEAGHNTSDLYESSWIKKASGW